MSYNHLSSAERYHIAIELKKKVPHNLLKQQGALKAQFPVRSAAIQV